jgi:hypothetical protein
LNKVINQLVFCFFAHSVKLLPDGFFPRLLIHNEQIKLTANWLNTLATAIVAAGVFAPLAAQIYGVSQMPRFGVPVALLTGCCFVFGAVLHLLGRLALRRLRE